MPGSVASGTPCIFFTLITFKPVPVAVRSKAQVCGRPHAEIIGSNSIGVMNVCCECCVLSGRGLCDELITRPEESYRLWCVAVCYLENLVNEEAMTHWELSRPPPPKNTFKANNFYTKGLSVMSIYKFRKVN